MNNKLIWIVIGAVIVVAGAFVLVNNNAGKNQEQTTENQTANPTQAEQAKQPQQSAVTVTSSGFDPATITVAPGTQVVWTNTSGVDVTVSSDAHPTHLLFPFLNLGNFSDGSSVSVVFEKAGTYTYHNHFNASQKGTILVQ